LETKIYTKNGISVIEYKTFVYVTEIFLYAKRYFSLVKKEYYQSNIEIPNIVGSFWKNKHFEICSELYAAPKQWLENNGYELYIKPIKKKKIKKIK